MCICVFFFVYVALVMTDVYMRFFFVYVALVMKDVYMRRFFFCIGSIGGVRIE